MSADPIRPGGTVSILPSWRCRCLKCGATSDWRCDCPAVDVPKLTFNDEFRISVNALHKKSCGPPEKCPNQECRRERWWEPAKWRWGQGASEETLRRRRVKRKLQRQKRRSR